MPRCEKCSNSVPSFDLRYVQGEKTMLVCRVCRAPTDVVASQYEMDQQLAAVSLHQYETADGRKDYQVKAEVSVKGLDVNYKFTLDEARQFFKNGSKKVDLKAV